MLTVAVTTTKGGSGKTTIATHLAARFAAIGHCTALADFDRQRSALDWLSRRNGVLPTIQGLDFSQDDPSVPRKVQRLVVDVPAGMKRAKVEDVVRNADILVIPVLPSAFDEVATLRFLETLQELKPVRKGRRAIAVVGNRIRAHTRAAERLDRMLEQTGHPVITRLRESQLYITAAAEGTSLFDMRGQKAAGYVEEWGPLLAFIEGAALG